MADELNNVAKTPHLHLTDKDAIALMKILVSRGYFHEKLSPSGRAQYSSVDPSSKGVPLYRKDDALLIETTNNCYIMVTELRKRFMDLLLIHGRITILDAMKKLEVNSDAFHRHVVPWIVRRDTSDEFIVVITPNGMVKEILSVAYVDDQMEALWSILQNSAENGMMLVSDAANSFFHTPMNITLSLLEKRINSHKDSTDIDILLTDNAAPALVTAQYLSFVRTELTRLLNNVVDAPIDVKDLAKENEWEVNWVLQMINKEGFLVSGEFHGDTFVPHCYVESQRLSVTSLYATNGFVTSHMCYALYKISTSQMKEYATHNQLRESYILLPNSVVDVNVIVAPLIEAARYAMESSTWLDLQLHIPVELLENETSDARMLVETLVLNDEVRGTAFMRSDGALFFSEPMVKSFVKEHLNRVKSKMAISRAMELVNVAEPDRNIVSGWSIDGSVSESKATKNCKEKRKGRRTANDSSNEGVSISADEIGEFPVDGVVQAIVELYPDLLNLETTTDVLSETCRIAFCTDQVESLWVEAVRCEVERLLATKNKLASASLQLGQTDVVTLGFKSIDAAFEDPGCFATSCYMIQAKAKFLLYALQSSGRISDEMKHQLKLDFFNGCCLDFSYRITRYALYNKNVEDGIFDFGSAEGSEYRFYSPVDLGSCFYPEIFLSCSSKRKDVLTVLQEELPGGVGSALAKLWMLCGETHFQQDSAVSESMQNDCDDGIESVERFLSHLRENCLIVCGLPFAILDKKAEKKFLSLRRTRLMQLLDSTTDLAASLDYAIMILYQNCKNLVTSGPLLRGSVLKLLSSERKVSETVAEELVSLALKVDQGDSTDFTFVARLREMIAATTKGM